ncbi:hypothetical protein TSOC_009689, partial [Tetrabaena socialis]
MLRQSGLAANRLLLGSGLVQSTSSQTGSSKLLWNAALFSSKAEGAAAQQVAASEGIAQTVPQYSSEAVAALAAKRKGLIGSGISLSHVKPFSARGIATSAQAASPAAAAAVEVAAQPADKYAGLKKMLKVAAAVAAALGLTATTAMADSPAPWQYGFQDTATSTAQ